MMALLMDISRRPAARHLDKLDIIEICYDIEDIIDAFMVRDSSDLPKPSLKLFTPKKIRQFSDIRNIKSRLEDSAHRLHRYGLLDIVINDVDGIESDRNHVIFTTEITGLIGIDEARDELIQIMMEGNEVSNKKAKIVSVVGSAGLGKTTLAHVVYQNLRARFDCSAFSFVRQNPDIERVIMDLINQLGNKNDCEEILGDRHQLIAELRDFLREKRYLIVIDGIWDILVWDSIRPALPDDNGGSVIITTTRSFKVAYQVGGDAYRLKPLSLQKSKILFYSRVFDNQESEECPDKELAEVSDGILKKCAGVPLAIVTMASMLISTREKTEWNEVYNTVGTGLRNFPEMDNMMKVLSFSYYDLPQHLRVCLLYLSVFPEDHKIEKNRLIWMWIAEGFIRCENGRNLFELGDSYFSELIDRSLIELMYDDIIIEYCHVNSVMLHLIRSLSSEENFVTVDFDYERQASTRVLRRLSFQSTKEQHAMTSATMSMQHVRSAIVFPYTVNLIPALPSFRVLRVPDLQDCFLSQACGLKHLGTLFNLRYLGLRGTGIADLPEEVGNLQFLQTLDITCNEISGLPTTFGNLITLKCLRIDFATRVPLTVFASLTSLEELSGICIYDSTDIEILSRLTELSVLDISYHIEDMDCLENILKDSLCKLQKIQYLYILVASGECKADSLVVPEHIRQLSLRGCWLSKLPALVDSELVLSDLTAISIAIIELQQEHLEILGLLPALRYLNLKVDHENLNIQRRFIVGAYLFPRLDMREIAGSSDGAFDVGLTNLLSLQHVIILFRCGGASEKDVIDAKDALRHASKIHPNGPTIDIVG